MQQVSANQPIGIFDSGIGGLTVAHALVNLLPKENIIYFGDTAHLPYGDKSAAAIQAYAVKITQILLQQQCKVILIACNTASAVAYDLVREYLNGEAIVMNVIDPVVYWVKENCLHKNVGLIGTKQTVSSNIYHRKLTELHLPISLRSYATPLLASAIEEGFADKKVMDALLEEYLSHQGLQDIEVLILACTHYPVVKDKIAAFFEQKVNVIDTSHIVAKTVAARLAEHNLLNKEGEGAKRFYISDYTESFAQGARRFFQGAIELEHYPLWE
jgi:glutamate racemase